MAFKLCTLQDVQDRYRGTGIHADHESLIDNQIIPAITLALAHEASRPDWDKKVRSEYLNYDPSGTRRIFVQSPPIAASPTVQVWESGSLPRVYGADELLTIDEDYFVMSEEGIIIKDGLAAWASGINAVKITYTGGHLAANGQGAPADLVEACIRQVKLVFDRMSAGGISSESVGGGSFAFSSGLKLDPSVTEILREYKLHPNTHI